MSPRLVLISGLFCVTAHAAPPVPFDAFGGFKCPETGRIVGVGLSPFEVKLLCRAPDDAQQRTELRQVRRVVQSVERHRIVEAIVEETREFRIDTWTYDFGRNRFLRILHFENGVLVAVETGPKGAADPQ